MAGNFGLDAGGNVVIQEPASTGNGPATRITGGGNASFTGFGSAPQAPNSNFGAIQDSSVKALDALNKLTQGILQPLVEAEQKRQYFEGMAQVAQGQTLLEVQKDQPWYTKIFGPSASVQGAQAMTLMAAMNTAEHEFYSALPSLAEKGPDEMRAWVVDQASRLSQTGDPTMDAMIQAKLAEQMGPMMGQHLKHHLKFVQEQSAVTFGNNVVTAGKALQDKEGVGAGFFTPEQMQLERDRAVESLRPMDGMTSDAWQSNVVKSLRAGMMEGNFALYEAFKQSDMYQKLPVDKRDHLDNQVLPYATQFAQAKSPAYWKDMESTVALEMALAQGAGPQTLAELDTFIDAQNAAFATRSGSSAPKFDNKGRAALYKKWEAGQEFLRRQREVAYKAMVGEQAKYQDAIAQQTATGYLLDTGQLPPNAGAIESANVQQELRGRWAAVTKEGGPALTNHIEKLAVASNIGTKWMDDQLSANMKTAANNFLQQGIPVSDDMRQQLQYMGLMAQSTSGLAALSNYVGAENAAKMTAFIRSGVDLSDKSAVDTVRTSIERGWNAPVTAADRKVVQNFLDDQDTFLQRNLPLFGAGALSAYNMNDANKARLGGLLQDTAARLNKGNGIPMEEAVPLAFSLMFGNSSKIDYVDGSFTEPSPASEFESMFAVVSRSADIKNQASEDYQQALKNTIDKSMGFDVSKVVQDAPLVTGAERFGQKVADFGNKVFEYKFGFTLPGHTTGPGKFDPENYYTSTVKPIGHGVLQVTRLPKVVSFDARPVTVTITAEQVIDELTGIYKSKAQGAVDSRQRSQDMRDAYRKPSYDPLSDLIK